MTPRESYVSRNARNIKQLREKLEKFTKELLMHPGHTMEWADSAFATAAKLDLATDIRTNLEAGVTLQRIHEYLQERVMDHARYINNYSTSSSANHMKHCQLAAMVDELEVVNGLMKHE